MFIIVSVIIVVSIVLLRNSLNLTKILESKRYLESGLERSEFLNVKNEVRSAIRMNVNQSNITDNVEAFVKFARAAWAGRIVTLKGIIVTTVHGNISANVDNYLNVSVVNMFPEELEWVNLTFNGSRHNFSSVDVLDRVKTNFTFVPDGSVNKTLIVDYKGLNVNTTENITIPFEIGKSKFVGFFDLRFVSDRLEQNDKFTETVEINVTRGT